MRKLHVVIWVLDGKPGALTSFDFREVLDKANEVFDAGGFVTWESYWVS